MHLPIIFLNYLYHTCLYLDKKKETDGHNRLRNNTFLHLPSKK